MPTKHHKYLVLGAGISGLTAAVELQAKGEDVAILESKSKPGGVLQSVSCGLYSWDRAAHTLAVDEEVMQFLSKYGIAESIQKPSDSSKVRQIAIDGKIWDISNHPGKIIAAKYLSVGAKVKLVRELFKRSISIENPTVSEFFDYHFGKEITRNIISAVFAGIYAGDIEKMEMKSVMSKVFEIEQQSGSLIRGLVKNKGTFGKRKIYGFKGGMASLGRKLAENLYSIYYDQEAIQIQKVEGQFIVTCKDEIYTCERLISTLPAYALKTLVADISSPLSSALDHVYYEPMVLIHVGFANVEDTPTRKAFGFLCSQFSSPVLKGAIYNGDLFQDRAPKKGKSYTIFMKPKAEWLDNKEELDSGISQTISQFKKLTEIKTKPEVVEKSIWKYAIPQFNRPYADLKSKLLKESQEIKGFTLSGSYISGVSVPDCIKYNIGIAGNV